MIDFLLGIFTDIIASTIMKISIPRLLPNSITRFWDPLFKGGLVIVTPAEEKEPEIKSQALDFHGLEALTKIFQTYYKNRYQRTSCDNLNQELLEKNLLLVGGPIPNTLTRHILKPENPSVRYYFSDHKLIDKQNPEFNLVEELVPEGMYPTLDHAIISCFKNPFNTKKNIVISSGVYGWGTYAGLIALADKEILKFLLEHAVGREFQVLIKVGIFNRIPQEPELLKDSLHLVLRAISM